MRILSGVQPSGRLHIGNWFGAIRQFVALQGEPANDCFYFVADLHAMTSSHDGARLRARHRGAFNQAYRPLLTVPEELILPEAELKKKVMGIVTDSTPVADPKPTRGLLLETFGEARRRREELIRDPAEIERVLRDGAERAAAVMGPVLAECRRACGLGWA